MGLREVRRLIKQNKYAPCVRIDTQGASVFVYSGGISVVEVEVAVQLDAAGEAAVRELT